MAHAESADAMKAVKGAIPREVLDWSHVQDSDTDGFIWSFQFSLIELRLFTNSREQPVFCELRDTHMKIPRRALDPLRQKTREILLSQVSDDNSSEEDRTQVHTEQLENTKRDTKPIDDRHEEISKLAALISQALQDIASTEKPLLAVDNSSVPNTGWNAAEVTTYDILLTNPIGLDSTTIADTAFDLLGKTPQQIHQEIPSSWRVIHIESVVRPDLAQRFLAYQARLREKFTYLNASELRSKLPPHISVGSSGTRHQDLVENLVRPGVGFHGTALHNVGSIVQHGFKLPSKKLRDGRPVGYHPERGIYSSPASWYAMSYSGVGGGTVTDLALLQSKRLIVCAVIMGRTYRGSRHRGAGSTAPGGLKSVHGELVEGYDSHFDGGYECMVYEEAAILPCYVVHLDMGSEEARRAVIEAQSDAAGFERREKKEGKDELHPRLRVEKKSPGDIKREKEAKKAAAMKWFPYGFGSATGTKFVIEEVGSTSDDEEEYGDWQKDKHAFSRSDVDDWDPHQADQEYYDDWDEDGHPVKKKRGAFLDQYQGARKARHETFEEEGDDD